MKITLLKKKSLLSFIENSIKGGNNYLWRNLFARDENGNVFDILQNGNVSCGVFVSTLLLNLELIKRPHATVGGVEGDLIGSGWLETKNLESGAVLIWEEKTFGDGSKHRHIGFYVGNDEAISNSTEVGFPARHHVTYDGTRKLEKIYWHPDLDKG